MRVLILLTLLGAAVAVPKNVQRIVGGSPTTIETYPYMSNMHWHWFGAWWVQVCGGSLITTQAVLSAANCYFGDSASEWRVRLGTSYRSSGGTEHAVSQLIVHSGYRPTTHDNDVAIVRLATPTTFSDSIAVANIPSANYNLADGTVVTTIGWGALTSDGANPEQLQHVDINIINQEYCVAQYAYLKTLPGYSSYPDVTDNMLCAGIQYVGGKDSCRGDAGGPIAHNGNVIVGIISWGYGCAHANYPGVNTRVNRYVDWIVSNA